MEILESIVQALGASLLDYALWLAGIIDNMDLPVSLRAPAFVGLFVSPFFGAVALGAFVDHLTVRSERKTR